MLMDNAILGKCRSISGTRGFSKETLIALVANLESREWRYHYNTSNNIPIEHPRASTTDVSVLFNVLCDTVGQDFTLKQVNGIVSCFYL